MLLKLKLSTHYVASNPSKFHMDDTCLSVFSSHSLHKTTSFFHLPPQIPCVMRNTTTLLFFLSVLLCHGAMAIPEEGEEDNMFFMHKPKRMVKTDAGEMRVLKTQSGCRRFLDRHMHIAFITMEPNSLFVPHYLDSNLIIFIHKGEANLGFIYDDEVVEKRLKAGDVYVIPSGSAFYFLNMEEGQRLHIICSIDTSTSLGLDTFHSFYIGGGANSHSLLSEFGPAILETAFNESRMEVESIFYKELDGSIMYMDDSHAPSLETKFLQLKKEEKEQQLNKMLQDQEEEKEEKKQTSSSWEKLLDNVFGKLNEKTQSKNSVDWSKATNLYDKKTDFRNDYGWSKALDGVQYSPLTKPDTGLFYVYLKAGSMLGPHVNRRASEYTIVVKGCGELHIVYPNGSKAISIEIKQGDVFVVPKSFPLCQIASRDGPLELFGFSTSAKDHKPLFLAGSVSILRTMLGPQLAAALGVSVDTLRRALDPQDELLIFPSTWSAPP